MTPGYTYAIVVYYPWFLKGRAVYGRIAIRAALASPAGAIADRWGVPLALTIQGALMAAILAALWLSRSRVRSLG